MTIDFTVNQNHEKKKQYGENTACNSADLVVIFGETTLLLFIISE